MIVSLHLDYEYMQLAVIEGSTVIHVRLLSLSSIKTEAEFHTVKQF